MKRGLLATICCAFVAAANGCGSSSSSSAFDEGVRAAEKGDYTTALSLWLPLAQAGDSEAQFTVGYLYANGLGVAQDNGAARGWYERSALQGHSTAQYNLAGIYLNGSGDQATGVYWLRQAALRGSSKAQNNLSLLYSTGEGVTQDTHLSIRWLLSAASSGDAAAEYNLGSRYLHGIGVEENYPEAAAWFSRAAEKYQAEAINSLGFMYEHGKGVTSDPVLAYALYQLSVSSEPSTTATRNLSALGSHLAPSDIEAAQALVAEMSNSGGVKQVLARYEK